MTIDINCDMGEGMPSDAAIMPFISSANIACGYHAGDEDTLRKTIDLCLKHGVAIGAHPGFDDKQNFGRVPVQLSGRELYELVRKQLELIEAVCREKKAKLHHVKPHGALYNMAAKDRLYSRTIAQSVADFNPELIYYGLSGSIMIDEAQHAGLLTANEIFADRTYQPDGTLTPRSQPDALIHEVDGAVHQVLQMVTEKIVTCSDGTDIPIQADTICIHGDGVHALDFARAIFNRLKSQGIEIRAVQL